MKENINYLHKLKNENKTTKILYIYLTRFINSKMHIRLNLKVIIKIIVN